MSQPHLILLVDDNSDDVFFMQRALKHADIRLPVEVAASGTEAIDFLGRAGEFAGRPPYELPLLVLLDLKLPGKDGHEVLAWIRQQPKLRTTIVIVLTTSRERCDVEKAYQCGANAYLVKPSSAPQLIEQVKALKAFWLEQNEYGQAAEA